MLRYEGNYWGSSLPLCQVICQFVRSHVWIPAKMCPPAKRFGQIQLGTRFAMSLTAMLDRAVTAVPCWVVACQFLLVAGGCGTQGDSSASASDRRVAAPGPIGGTPASQAPGVPAPSITLRPLDPSQAVVATDRFNSAQVCGACHKDIFEKWSRSMHAMSYTDPVFEDAFLKAFYHSGGTAAELCLGCHSPTVTQTNDVLGRQKLTREGVTCDYCHSTASIVADPDGSMSYTIDHSKRYGPHEVPSPDAHEVERRPYFKRSEICAGCHDYTTADGTPVFTTYTEWRSSKYAEKGTHCQDCHMPRLVRSGAAPAGEGMFNDHDLQGGHSPSQIKRAVVARIEKSTRDADRVRIVVVVENHGAGHSVPTGLPSKMLILTASATQRGRPVFHRETVYQRIMLDDNRRRLTNDWEIKLRSKHVLRDNRIRSGEVRRETFVFDASPTEDIIFKVRLAYRHQPTIATEQTMEVQITESEKIIARGM